MKTRYLFALIIILQFVSQLVDACGCYGQGSCYANGTLKSGPRPADTPGQIPCDPFNSPVAVCDCCPACNSCAQLFSGCLRPFVKFDVSLQPPVPHAYAFNRPITPSVVTSVSFPGNLGTSFIEVCLDKSLPKGLVLAQTSDFRWVLSGTPIETLPLTYYNVLVKGSVGYLGMGWFALSVTGACS
ncbi:hypothetical protein BV898_17174 [Hypsibius exemplaris]|uniref:Uncharacterized protein n=1 Tax=Hypsibius exemplaris TaxID=2072580 RepID=A0A9X6RLS4_HYPEX|nr:hypothetical protein BV898_17174 [Hypsibius exemplaris]